MKRFLAALLMIGVAALGQAQTAPGRKAGLFRKLEDECGEERVWPGAAALERDERGNAGR